CTACAGEPVASRLHRRNFEPVSSEEQSDVDEFSPEDVQAFPERDDFVEVGEEAWRTARAMSPSENWSSPSPTSSPTRPARVGVTSGVKRNAGSLPASAGVPRDLKPRPDVPYLTSTPAGM